MVFLLHWVIKPNAVFIIIIIIVYYAEAAENIKHTHTIHTITDRHTIKHTILYQNVYKYYIFYAPTLNTLREYPLVSQFLPVKCAGQSHSYFPLATSWHVPPFIQGLLSHSSAVEQHRYDQH